MGFCASTPSWRDEVRRIQMSAALPCGIGHCGRPTTRALIEDDLERPALWTLLPICDDCARAIATQQAKPRPEKDVSQL